MPLSVPSTCVVRRLWWTNGSTVNASNNLDIGIYASTQNREPGVLVVSAGSTAQGTASQVQFVDVTDTTLAPGLYWIALTASVTAASTMRTSLSVTPQGLIVFSESSALPLPSTATPVESAYGRIYLCGFATTASP